MTDKLIFNCTYGSEDPERATLPFVAANVAASAGQDAVVLCTIEAVWLGTSDGAKGVAQPGLPVLDDLFNDFVDNGGQVWLCGACTKPRGIGEDQLRKGASIVGAAKVVEEVIAGAKTVAINAWDLAEGGEKPALRFDGIDVVREPRRVRPWLWEFRWPPWSRGWRRHAAYPDACSGSSCPAQAVGRIRVSPCWWTTPTRTTP